MDIGVDLSSKVRSGRIACPGIVYLVGAGPGDLGLITVRGRELIDDADVVVYDALANPELLTAHDPSRLIFVGKRGGDSASASQEDITATLIQQAQAGKSVVRLKGGDPLVFGRGSEEAQALAAAGIAFEIVPGVTAGIAVPAYAGIPVTHRGVATSVTFVTGHEDPSKADTQTDWSALARAGGTIVLYMSVGRLRRIAAALIAGGLAPDTPAAAIQWGTYSSQRTVVGVLTTLADRIAEAELSAPLIMVIGPAVALRDEIRWFDRPETHPLMGRRILVTRATAQASTVTRQLRALGAVTIETPSTCVIPTDTAPLGQVLQSLDQYTHLIFSSQTAVELFWDVLLQTHRDARALHRLTIAVVGPTTAEALLSRGIAVDIVPERFVAEGLLEALAAGPSLADARVLYPSAVGARDTLPNGLRDLGATVDVVPLYQSVNDGRGSASLREAIQSGTVDLVTFTSGSSVRGYVDAVGSELARRVPAVSIGPTTSEAARQAGIEILAEATTSNIAGLVEAVMRVASATQLSV